MSAASDFADTFQFRLESLANEERRQWGDNKERAVERLAAKLKASPRQVQRWLRPDGIKEPKVSLWFRVERLWDETIAAAEARAQHVADIEHRKSIALRREVEGRINAASDDTARGEAEPKSKQARHEGKASVGRR